MRAGRWPSTWAVVKVFVQAMNGRAVMLGLADTKFADPCGHDREGQYTSAADLARASPRRS